MKHQMSEFLIAHIDGMYFIHVTEKNRQLARGLRMDGFSLIGDTVANPHNVGVILRIAMHDVKAICYTCDWERINARIIDVPQDWTTIDKSAEDAWAVVEQKARET